MEEFVQLSKIEYDHLKKIEHDYDVLKNTPDKYIKFCLPERYDGVIPEIKIYSGEEAILKIERIYEINLDNLKEEYEDKIKESQRILKKYKPIIDAVRDSNNI